MCSIFFMFIYFLKTQKRWNRINLLAAQQYVARGLQTLSLKTA